MGKFEKYKNETAVSVLYSIYYHFLSFGFNEDLFVCYLIISMRIIL